MEFPGFPEVWPNYSTYPFTWHSDCSNHLKDDNVCLLDNASSWSIDLEGQVHDATSEQQVSRKQVMPEFRPLSRLYCCAACLENVMSAAALDEHAQRTGHKSFACLEAGCSKSYPRRDSLARHKSGHRASAFKCPYCPAVTGKSFTRKDHLMSHIRRKHAEVFDTCPDEIRLSLNNGPAILATSSPSRIDEDLCEEIVLSADAGIVQREKDQLKSVLSSLRLVTSNPARLSGVEGTIDALSVSMARDLIEKLATILWTLKNLAAALKS